MDPRRVVFEAAVDWYEWKVYDADGELVASKRCERVTEHTMAPDSSEAHRFESDMAPWPDLYDAIEGSFVGTDLSNALKTYYNR